MWGFALLQNKHTISLKLSLTSNHYVFGGSFICVQINEPRRSDSGDESSFRRIRLRQGYGETGTGIPSEPSRIESLQHLGDPASSAV